MGNKPKLSKRKLKTRKKIEKELGISVDELEKLDYYDIMSHIEFPLFALGGLKSTEHLLEMCRISEDKKVLIVGCGQGNTAIHIAKKYECEVIGIDIAEYMIKKAIEKIEAEPEEISNLVSFEIGDAYDLQFEERIFDLVISQFTSQFLDLDKAFKEFSRILKSGGYIGLNEMYKMEDIPEKKQELIELGKKQFTKAIGLDFRLYPPSVWKKSLESASMTEIQIEEHPDKVKVKGLIKQIGGWKKLFKIVGIVLKLYRSSKIIKKIFKNISKGKRYLMRKRYGGKYIGYILISAKKP